jgi:cell wall-associated NlpC family hydrolase
VRAVVIRRNRQAPFVFVALATALLAAVPAIADPSAVQQKQTQELDSRLGKAVESYNLANVRLQKIQADLRENAFELKLAKSNLKVGQKRMAKRVVELYTSSAGGGTMEIILGAQSLDDLITRLETVDRVTSLDAGVVKQVRFFKDATRKHARLLAEARAAQQKVVAQREADKRSIESQLSQRQSLLASIKDQIARMQAAEAARQARIAREARARVAAMEAAQQAAADPNPPVALVADATAGAPADQPTAAPPPSQHGGVVGIAMRYLGVPYAWGGASPAGFDCSGLVSYAFAQIGVSVPHSSYAIWGMGSAVSRDQLQPGDLVFFDGLGHVGIYIGGGQFVHAPHTGDVVKVSSLGESWYASTYVGARRL